MKPEVMAWSGIFTGPLAWFLNLEANFALAPLACTSGAKLPLYLVSGVAVALTLLAGSMSFTRWQTPEPRGVQSLDRTVAFAGVWVSGLSLLVIIAQVIPILLLSGCE